jgi:hypothetical protein
LSEIESFDDNSLVIKVKVWIYKNY